MSVRFEICDEKRKYFQQMKEIVQMNYIKADIDFLKLGEKGSLNYFYQTMIINAVQKAIMMMMIIIIFLVMMPKARIIMRTMQTRLTL